MTQTDLNKQIIRRFTDEVVNTGNVALLADLISPDCVETDSKVRIVVGVTGMVEHINAVRAIYPNLFLTIERQVAEGEWVATQITARGTHSREWLGMRSQRKIAGLHRRQRRPGRQRQDRRTRRSGQHA